MCHAGEGMDNMSSASTRMVTRWTTRIIPVVLAGCVGFATYVVIKPICVDFYIRSRGLTSTAIALLVPYCVLLVLVTTTYIRLLLVVAFDPGVVPLGPGASNKRRQRRRQRQRQRRLKSASQPDDIEAQPYEPGPDNNPDSPGLERFYSKDVFVCDADGRPRYCSACRAWKPDRSHHSSEINRCVRKMDHYCPWVGGIISETSFKFFIQFTLYTSLYCAVCLVASVLCLSRHISENVPLDGTVIAIIALGAFFGLFTFGMIATSLHYIFSNLTNVEMIRQKTVVYLLAIRVPQNTPPGPNYGIITYPLPKLGEPSNGAADLASSRDRLATRTFAIVATEPGENPWDLGRSGNWTSVMGTNILDWLFPVRYSPCVYGETNESLYRMGPLYDTLRTRYDLPKVAQDGTGGVEMGHLHR